ncbi:MAG: hypothetical protein IKI87_09525 [Clostridiales bacterium]|nr:hypothetical protein [Clostridiales bacterium]
MDLFHRAQEPEKRELTWVKPFDNRMDEILRLKEKSETCPKEMKKVFLSAWGELASHVKSHQKVASQIVKSGLPLNVYYNVTMKTDMAYSTIDFLIISDELIVVVLFKTKEHIEWDRYDTRFAKLPEAPETRDAEEKACILADWLQLNRVLSGKDMARVVPVLIDEEAGEGSAVLHPVERSEIYEGISKALRVSPDVFDKWLLENCEESEFPVFVSARLNKVIAAIEQAVI